MIALVEAGQVGIILAKDMSRIGRNYLEVGFYTEVMFPKHNVRFIAVNSGVDSANQQDNDFTPFLNIINEFYVKDTSKKIIATMRQKGESGQYLTTHPPYGYTKDPDNPKHWIVDEEAAVVVRQIFAWCMEGWSIHDRTQTGGSSHRMSCCTLGKDRQMLVSENARQPISMVSAHSVRHSQ